jgi:hypothetical protein
MGSVEGSTGTQTFWLQVKGGTEICPLVDFLADAFTPEIQESLRPESYPGSVMTLQRCCFHFE